MLVLTRKVGEEIQIDSHIHVVIIEVHGKQVRLGIDAPKETKIHRKELLDETKKQNTQASQSPSIEKIAMPISNRYHK